MPIKHTKPIRKHGLVFYFGGKFMQNKLEIFKNEQFGEIRTVIIGGEPWFVLKDICDSLGISNPSRVVERLDEDEVRKISPNSKLGLGNPGDVPINAVNESGVYSVVLRSDKPEAKQFKRWLTHEVIPQIRKTGMYATENFVDMALNDTENMIKILKAYETEKKAKKEIKLKLEEKTIQLDENKKWFSIKRVASLNNKNWRSFDWKRLKNTSNYLGFEVKKVFDANYSNGVSAYHEDIWKHEYPGMCFRNKTFCESIREKLSDNFDR
jgi:prophage antirepressor-like protein